MTQINYTLVKYTDDDYQFVYDLKKDAYKQYVELNYGPWNDEQQIEMFDEFLKARKDYIQIIMIDNNKIGFVDGKDISETEYEQGNICISKPFQGKGIGTDFLTNLFTSHPNQNISLRVFKQNPAQNLYKRLGFEIVCETKTHFNMMKKSK